MAEKLKIGFIGQGFIGKNYADDFAERGYDIVRYDIEKYKNNKDKIKDCDYVLIAVPTPTTPTGFDYSIIEAVLPLIGAGKVAVIKSTIKIGTTRRLQAKFPTITIMHSPEFLTEKTAAQDARHPERNIIGILDEKNPAIKKKAETLLSLLPKAPYKLITKAENAELIKYAGNCWFYCKVVFVNMLYDLAQKHKLDYDIISESLSHDSRVGKTHLSVSHQGGRGAGGHCFIKDFETFIEMLSEANLDKQKSVAEAIRDLNIDYMRMTGKDLDLLKGVYGK